MFSLIRAGLWIAALVVALGVCDCTQGAGSPAPREASRFSPQALQACVERWNWMNYRGHFADGVAPAKVRTRPCRVEIAYTLPRSDPLYRLYLRTIYFPCAVNRFGAFVCPEHALGRPTDPPRKGHNARYFPLTGRIQLDRPPAQPVATPKPDWVRRYPVAAGFIVPFDRDGRFRSGLKLRGRRSANKCFTFAKIRQRSRLYGCGAGLYCFAPSLPHYDRQPLACPEDRGSRVFDRGVLRLLGG
jgi:hypothetical protein